MPICIGCKPQPPDKCRYLDSEEDHYKTTIYPICTCKMKYCNEYHGYCPVRDS